MADPADRRSPAEQVIDALVYAPIGLALDVRALVPDLARRGRSHVRNARVLGQLAVGAGVRRVRTQFEEDDDGGPAPEDLVSEAPRPVGDSPPVDDLAIPEYDSLAASQVVQRLPGLSADELDTIRRYEAANRGRRTILTKIARLQGD